MFSDVTCTEWLEQWATPTALKKHEAAVDKLTQLQLLKQPTTQRGPRSDEQLSLSQHACPDSVSDWPCAGVSAAHIHCTLISNHS